MLTAHRIALDPNNIQATYFAKACGVARFAYNWALAEWQKQYDEYKKDSSLPKPTETALRRLLNSIKKQQFPWMLEITKNAPQMAIIQLGKAFQNFFSGRAKYPQFRKKGRHDRFTLTNDQFDIKDLQIRIPHLGWVRMREHLRFAGKIISATISRIADKWFVSVTVEIPDPLKALPNTSQVGVDLGVSHLATLSTGEKISGPKPHTALLKRLRSFSKGLSRKQKGSKNRAKAKTKLARLYARIANIRLDAIHKFTTELVNRFSIICIEDLNVTNMLKNRRLSRCILDMGFYELRRQLEYKTKKYQSKLICVDRYFPSSKTCSNCKNVICELPLSIRHWKCHACGIMHDRDVNAAINLVNYTASSAGI
ncbi:MAG TPA: RNA-guided endonuclease TnpB family protein [Chlamydiales bacterium]|nr:RNA-guided endonuclease TnpB family protein [Chlamydiales bacterium]